LDDALALAAEAEVDARAELLRGDPVDEIVAFADSFEADLIVVGSRGHGALASALLGSVSRWILSETRRPVLVVRGAAERIAAVAVPAYPCGKPAAAIGPATDGTEAAPADTGRERSRR